MCRSSKMMSFLVCCCMLVLCLTPIAYAAELPKNEARIPIQRAEIVNEQELFARAIAGIDERSDFAKEIESEGGYSAYLKDKDGNIIRPIQAFQTTQLVSRVLIGSKGFREDYITTILASYSKQNSVNAGAGVRVYVQVFWSTGSDSLGVPYVQCTSSKHWITQTSTAVRYIRAENEVCRTIPNINYNSGNFNSPSSGTKYTLSSPDSAPIHYLTEIDSYFSADSTAYFYDDNSATVNVFKKF